MSLSSGSLFQTQIWAQNLIHALCSAVTKCCKIRTWFLQPIDSDQFQSQECIYSLCRAGDQLVFFITTSPQVVWARGRKTKKLWLQWGFSLVSTHFTRGLEDRSPSISPFPFLGNDCRLISCSWWTNFGSSQRSAFLISNIRTRGTQGCVLGSFEKDALYSFHRMLYACCFRVFFF